MFRLRCIISAALTTGLVDDTLFGGGPRVRGLWLLNSSQTKGQPGRPGRRGRRWKVALRLVFHSLMPTSRKNFPTVAARGLKQTCDKTRRKDHFKKIGHLVLLMDTFLSLTGVQNNVKTTIFNLNI